MTLLISEGQNPATNNSQLLFAANSIELRSRNSGALPYSNEIKRLPETNSKVYKPMEIIIYSVLGVVGLVILLVLAFGIFFTVDQQNLAAVERFGKFKRIARAGLGFKIPLIDSASRRLSLRVMELPVRVETITADKVSVAVETTIQYQVLESRAEQAFYRLSDPEGQIKSYVFDQVRAEVPEIELDEVFTNKEKIAQSVKQELASAMDDFGYQIINVQVTDVDPDANVKKAMNEINAAKRERIAAEERGEADKILAVKAAEAEAESKRLQGEGIANQRKAIVDGLRESVTDFTDAVEGAEPSDVMELVLMTQYFDTLKDVAASGQSKVIMVPHSPGGVADIKEQLRTGIVTGNELTNDGAKK